MEERTTLELKINICEAEKMNIAINVSQKVPFLSCPCQEISNVGMDVSEQIKCRVKCELEHTQEDIVKQGGHSPKSRIKTICKAYF